MTARVGRAERIGRLGVGCLRSVEHRVQRLPHATAALVGVIIVAELVHGFRVVGTPWFGGDLLYHQALAHQILRGVFPPEGPYAGLPTYYPPGFHLLLATTMSLTGLDAVRADQLLTLLWMPVLPVGTFLLARAMTGRPWVAVLAAALTVFAGAYDLRLGRIWVNSLFLGGQEAYPLYPRDLVFGLLPFAVFAFLRALRPDRTGGTIVRWSVLAGVLFGICGLVQVQLLLPLPVALVATAAAVMVRDPDRRRPTALAVTLTAIVASVVIAPWLLGQFEAIDRNGGVALDSSEMLETARFGFWSYPRQFGLLLPLAIVGSGAALLFLRRPDGPRPRPAAPGPWRADPPEAGLLLVSWFALAFALAVLYRPDWPLEDALRPQRMWLLASQPLLILAAIGLVTAAEAVLAIRRPRTIVPVVVIVAIVACVPATIATARLLAQTWTRPAYAHLDLASDRVPDFRALLSAHGSSAGLVLTYEDWSSLSWYETGRPVVALVPAGFSKLAYDPEKFTGRSQATRRADLMQAFSGDLSALVAIADTYEASTIVLAARAGRWGLVDVSAALAPGLGDLRVAAGNGWDGLELAPGGRIDLPVEARGSVQLEIRVVGSVVTPATIDRTLVLEARGGNGQTRELARITAPATEGMWQVVNATVALRPGERLALVADDLVTVQSVRGFVDRPQLPAGWRLSLEASDAIVLERGS